MRGKYLVIGVMLAGLGVLVFALLRLERRRSQPRVVRVVEQVAGEVDITASAEEIAAAADRAEVRFRCAADEFEHWSVQTNARGEKVESWQRLFLVGTNLGVALPGRYPTEFSATRADYARWLDQMGAAGINTVRAYTILPPEFYQALAEHNFRNSEQPVYLLQGVWAELPASGDLFDPDYNRALKQEMRDAVDAVAGRAVRPERPGHAAGVYSADVSAFTLGYLFGREWEPDAVHATDSAHQAVSRYDGVFFSVPKGSATEVWLAGMLDYLVQYEVLASHVQRPVAFVNWLPLDPLFHETEYTDHWRARESDNDLLTLDPRALQTRPALRAGYYAAYHVYPYYPDFVFLDSAYRAFRDARGAPDCYAGYLHDLKRSHAGLPLVVAEFGVPSSRGSSHHSWQGMNHGGHDEAEQGAMNLAMLRAILDEGCAGGIVFAWLDEWFKRNWLIDDIAVPADRVRLWHNVQNPEQCFGMVRFGRELVTLDGATGDWPGRPLAAARDPGAGIRALWAQADEEYCYLRLDLGQAPDWSQQTVALAIDTYEPRLGSRRLDEFGLGCANGVEFLLVLRDTGDAEVLVDSGYSVFFDPAVGRPAYRTEANGAGRFVTHRLISNHLRMTAAAETIPIYATEFGRLTYGRSSDNSLADWYARDRVIEVRLPWALLNVTDPSSFQVLQDDPATDGVESATTAGFAFSAFVARKAAPGGVAAALPPARGDVIQFTRRWRWRGWEEPDYTERLKQGYGLFAAGLPAVLSDSGPRKLTLGRLAGARAGGVKARLARFRSDRSRALSLSFDDGSYDQVTNAVRILDRYDLKAGFGLVAEWTGAQAGWHAEKDGIPFLRMAATDARRLVEQGHTIAAHGLTHERDDADRAGEVALAVSALEQALGAPVRTYHYPYSAAAPALVEAVRRAGLWFGRVSGERANRPDGFDRFRLNSYACYNETLPDLKGYIGIVGAGGGKWTVLQYHHVLDTAAPELQTMRRHNVAHTYSVTPLTFGRHVRLARNADAWIAPVEDVGRYLLQARQARLDLRQAEQSVTFRIERGQVSGMPAVPMTVVLDVPWSWVTVNGSTADGVYSPYAGRLMLEALPGQDVIISRLAGRQPD